MIYQENCKLFIATGYYNLIINNLCVNKYPSEADKLLNFYHHEANILQFWCTFPRKHLNKLIVLKSWRSYNHIRCFIRQGTLICLASSFYQWIWDYEVDRNLTVFIILQYSFVNCSSSKLPFSIMSTNTSRSSSYR